MKIIKGINRTFSDLDPDHFVVPGSIQRLIGKEDGLPARLTRVSFEEGAQTLRHSHSGIQILFGLSGSCQVVNSEGTELRLDAGDVVWIEAGEEHWHGAYPGVAGEHLAITFGGPTKWLDSSSE